ncbi:MAG: glycosyltransferase family 39 protein [Syntrophaceae bacterium]
MNRATYKYFVLILITIGVLFTLFYRLGSIAYLETSEARYAEVAREMIESGDWVTPHLSYIKHFEKPPLTYWITATAFKIFGFNDWSGRVPLTLAALFILSYTWLLALLLFPDQKEQAALSVLVLFSSLLFLISSRTLTTDLYLALFTLGAIYHLLRWFLRDRHSTDAFLSALFLGFCILTKGHVIFIFYLIPWLPTAILYRQKRAVKVFDLLIFICVPLLICMPWFVAVIRDNPQLVSFYFKNQTIYRIVSDIHHRSEPIYFHLLVLCGGMLFWFTYFLFHLPRVFRIRENRSEGLLLLFTIIPLVLFSLIHEKLIPYLLPSMPFFAVLIAHWLSTDDSQPNIRWADRFNLVLAGGLIALEIMLPWIPANNVHVPKLECEIFATISLMLWLCMMLGWKHKKKELRMGFAALNLVLFFAIVTVAPGMQESFNSMKHIAAVIQHDRKDSAEYRIISYHDRLPSITFYTGKRIIQIPHDRNISFEDDESRKALVHYLSNDINRIPQLLAESVPTYFVIKKKDWLKLKSKLPGIESMVREIYANPDYFVFIT